MLSQPERSTATSSIWVRLWVGAVTLSAFGPYVLGGMRTEQLSVYASAVFVAVVGWPLVTRNWHAVAPFAFLWCAYFLIALFGGFLTTANGTQYDRGSLLAGLDNAALPLSLLVVTCYWTSLAPGFDLVRIAAKVLVVSMTVNGLLAVIEVIRANLASFTWLKSFWSSDPGTSVAVRAAGNGRYSGIFNQPAEAGIAYSLAVVCLLYLVQVNTRHRTAYVVLIGAVLTVGGVLTASKIFLIGGLPFMIYLVFRDIKRRTRLVLVGAVAALGVVFYFLSSSGLSLRWSGVAMFSRLLNRGDKSILRTFTANRFGEGSTLAGPAREVLDHHRWFGLGAGGLAVPYDSTWLEALIVGGIVGVVLLGLTYLLLVVRWHGLRGTLPGRESILAGSVIFVATVASLGMPSLTGNRIATPSWILLGLLVTSRQAKAVPGGARFLQPAWRSRLFSNRAQ